MITSNTTKARWNIAQEEELKCWKKISSNLQSKEYWEAKRELWRKILYKIDVENIILSILPLVKNTNLIKIVDVGCGPSGILCELQSLNDGLPEKHISFQYYGIDPLMTHYLEIVPELINYPIHWINGPGEDLELLLDNPAHIIFSLNALDHTRDIRQCLYSIEKCLYPGGVVIISLNLHSSYLTAWIFSKFNVEKLHPFQVTKKMFTELLAESTPSLCLEKVICLDDCICWLREKWSNDSNKIIKPKNFKQAAKNIGNAVGLRISPRYDGDRSIFHNYAFLLRKHKLIKIA